MTTAAGPWAYAFNVEVKEIRDKSILDVATSPVATPGVTGKFDQNLTCDGIIYLAVLHQGSNNMISFRYRTRSQPMVVTEKAFNRQNLDIPAGSFVIAPASMRSTTSSKVGDDFAEINRAAHERG
jgi:hypothetical protein